MNKKLYFFCGLLLLVSTTWMGCSTEFDVYAPENEIRIVYCVLDPGDSIQYVRVSTAYQVEGDAFVYASENDLSLSGKSVHLTGAGNTWIGTEVPNFPKDSGGIFIPNQTIYKFVTDGSATDKQEIVENETYRLEVGTADADDYVYAETTVPALPQIKGSLNVTSGAGNSRCLARIFLDKNFNFYWKKLDPVVRYEARVFFTFEKDGVSKTVKWGPTELLSGNKRCNEGSGSICYQFNEKELLNFFNNQMPDDGSVYSYVTKDSCVPNPTLLGLFPTSLRFEVTAVDEFLGNYINVNDPQFTDLTGAKPEYTNFQGNVKVVGVLGSVNRDFRYAVMRECSEALLNLNGTPTPVGCEW